MFVYLDMFGLEFDLLGVELSMIGGIIVCLVMVVCYFT